MVPEPGDLRRFLLLAPALSSAACGAGPQSAAVEVERTDSAGIEWASGSIAVEPDGTVNVFDFGKLGLVRFDAEGRTLDVRRVEALPHGGRFEIVDGSILLQLSEFDAARDGGADLLALISESGDSTILARFSSPPMRPISFSCGVAISGMAQLFAPFLVWAAREGVADRVGTPQRGSLRTRSKRQLQVCCTGPVTEVYEPSSRSGSGASIQASPPSAPSSVRNHR